MLISETQGLPINKNNESVYNEILASIRLESPTSSFEQEVNREYLDKAMRINLLALLLGIAPLVLLL